MHKLLIAALYIALLCQSVLANPNAGYPRSPEVSKDGRVTFRLLAPKATTVEIRGSFQIDDKQLRRTEGEPWEITIGPLEPGIYNYSFRVDGVYTLDPHNRWVKGWRRSANLFLVPGKPPRSWESQDTPRGEIHRHLIRSKSIHAEREVLVYTPPGYHENQNSGKTYPVLFLLHGSGDDATGWTNVGRAHCIADNLIAQSKAKPMVIVMPHGHADFDGWHEKQGQDWWDAHNYAVEMSFWKDIVPFINRRYRVSQHRDLRAIAGLSMGGGQSLSFGLKHPDQFGWVLAYSTGAPETPEKLQQKFGDLSETIKPKLLWIGCGRKDKNIKKNRVFFNLMKKRGFHATLHISDGGHSWSVWRTYLEMTLPLLFSESTSN